MTGGYGQGPDILHSCTIAVERGEIAVIVGPNGAGKSTAMKAVFGMLRLREGQVRLDGDDSSARPADRLPDDDYHRFRALRSPQRRMLRAATER